MGRRARWVHNPRYSVLGRRRLVGAGMSYAGHNGGPPLTEADVPNMTYVKFYPADFLNGTVHLSLEQRGAYITTLCVMYDRMSGFPYDEKEGAVLLRVDRRVYRRVRDDLLADGKFYRDGDVIRNKRVEDEIKDYISEYVRRSNAAREREERRRLHRTSGELRPDFSRTSTELVPEVQEKLPELEPKKPTKSKEQLPQSDHIPEARSQKPEARIVVKDNSPPYVPLASGEPTGGLRSTPKPAFSDPYDRVQMDQTGKPVLMNGLRQFWLNEFGGDNVRLDLALIEVAGDLQPNSRRSLESQVSSRLAKMARARRDQDERYAQAVKRREASSPTLPARSKPVTSDRPLTAGEMARRQILDGDRSREEPKTISVEWRRT